MDWTDFILPGVGIVAVIVGVALRLLGVANRFDSEQIQERHKRATDEFVAGLATWEDDIDRSTAKHVARAQGEQRRIEETREADDPVGELARLANARHR